MAGFEHDPENDVTAIRRLLDQYSQGFAFIKELIQNANDGGANPGEGASKVLLRWHPGLRGKGATHPLLQGPALLAINDGPFHQKDRDGLMRMGLGSGASDPDRIGRFGLGLKAAFHVCEGFFFLENSRDNKLREFCTPWHPKYYQTWDIKADDDDWRIMHDEVDTLFDAKRWFCIWIPLRGKGQCEKDVEPIMTGVAAFPGDSTDACPETLKAVFYERAPRPAELLLFLNRLRSFTFDDGCESIQFSHPEDGIIEPAARYFLKTVAPDSSLGKKWQDKSAWPRIFGVGERHQRIRVPDKARWEGGVGINLINDQPKNPTLRIFWSVFLPVGNTPCESLPLPGCDRDIHLFLHGYFFLNDSRTEILGASNAFKDYDEGTELGIRIAWNRELATSAKGVLHQFIPVLGTAIDSHELQAIEIHQMILVISESQWFRMYEKWITRALVFGRFFDSGKGWAWQSLPSSERLLVFPSHHEGLDSIENLVTSLIERPLNVLVRVEGWPGLFGCGITAEWTKEDIEVLVDGVWPRKLAFSPEQRSYLRSLISSSLVPISKSQAWKNLPIFELRNCRTGVEVIASAIDIEVGLEQNRIFIAGDQPLSDALLKACSTLNFAVVKSTFPPSFSIPKLDAEEAAGVLIQQSEIAPSQDRIDLLRLLIEDNPSDRRRQALRYLLHGSLPHIEQVDELLLFQSGEWSAIVGKLTRLLDTNWAWMDSCFADLLTEEQCRSLHCSDCNANAFREVCKKALDREDVSISQAELHLNHDFLLLSLNNGHDDHQLLARLPIHPIDEEHRTSINENVWLEPEEEPVAVNLVIWARLRQQAKIVRRSRNPMVRTAQTILFSDRLLDRDGVIRLASKQPAPSSYVELILECLSKRTPAQPAANALRVADWLPLKSGGACKMTRVVWLGEPNLQVHAIIGHLSKESELYSREDLAIDFDDDLADFKYRRTAWTTLVNPASPLLPTKEELVERLRAPIAEASSIHLGIPMTQDDRDAISEHLSVLMTLDEVGMPALGLVNRLWSSAIHDVSREWHRNISELFFVHWVDVNATKYDHLLEILRQHHRNSGIDDRARILRCFTVYLSHARSAGRWTQYRQDKHFELLNSAGDWTPIERLTNCSTGLERSACLDRRLAEALGYSTLPEALGIPFDNVVLEAQGDQQVMRFLREYAERMGDSLSLKQWSLLVTLFGPNARDLADKLTGNRTDAIRVELVGPDRSPPRIRLVRCTYRMELVTGDTVEVESVAGTKFHAPLETKITSLLVPKFGDEPGSPRYFDKIKSSECGEFLACAFRDPEQMTNLDPNQIQSCLEETIRIIQREVLNVEPAQRNIVHSMLEKSRRFEQLGVRMAQQELLGAGRLQLSQLGFRAEARSELAEALKDLESAEQNEAQAREEREIGFGDPVSTERNAASLKDRGLKRLRKCFAEDDRLHVALVCAMARRIGQEQYHSESVAFELFQNADDAYLELEGDEKSPGLFVADFTESEFRFGHWGRPINEPVSSDEEIVRSQKRDLVKMLILHGSDKGGSQSNGSPIGKFGLGFKSAFLITDQPSLISRDLAVQIRSGFFPVKLGSDEHKELIEWLKALRPEHRGGTAIRLPLRNACEAASSERFRALACYLPIFARRIREIRVVHPRLDFHWRPEAVPVSENATWSLETGKIAVGGTETNLLVLRDQRLCWVFGHAAGGLIRLSELPCIWITAPTLESTELGFAVNGPFEPDPGRTRLSTSKEGDLRNQELLSGAAELLSKFLAWIAKENPKLHGQEFEAQSFWTSVWRLFSRPQRSDEEQSGRSRLLAAVWHPDSGYARVLESLPILPNDLPGLAACLTSLRAIRFQSFGFLDSPQGAALLCDALSWEDYWNRNLQVRILPGEVVTSRVAGILKQRLEGFESPRSLTTAGLIQRLATACVSISPDLAGKLGTHLTKARLFPDDPGSEYYVWKDDDKRMLIEALAELEFVNELGLGACSKRLLVPGGTFHEGLRAAIAPASRLLGKGYLENPDAVSFFKFCRSDMDVVASDLGEWLKSSVFQTDGVGRSLALAWLASDDPLISDASRLAGEAVRDQILSSSEFQSLSEQDQHRVELAFKRGLLDHARAEGKGWIDVPIFPIGLAPHPLPPPPLEISDILDMWDEDAATSEFTVAGPLGNLILPGSEGDQAIASVLCAPASLEGKAAWYRLLCLGCSFSTLLGTSPRDRVIGLWTSRLGDDFWDKTIPDSLEQAGKAGFNQQLDKFFEGVIHKLFRDSNARGEDAEFWRRVFYDFRKMHHFVFRNHLPETLLEYTEFPQADGPGLINFLKTGEIQDDFRDPSESRFTGVIGQSMSSPLLFIMRELARLEVIDDRFSSACYYMNNPSRRIARRLGWIGDDGFAVPSFSDLLAYSGNVHERLTTQEPSFLGHYDLPLQWYALQQAR